MAARTRFDPVAAPFVFADANNIAIENGPNLYLSYLLKIVIFQLANC